MRKVTYGVKITLTRSDADGIDFKIDLPEVDRSVGKKNPALEAAFKSFDDSLEELLRISKPKF